MTKFITLSFSLLFAISVFGQTSYYQYFDGADTSIYNSLFPKFENSSTWQIGSPSKIRFNSAFTIPNAILTDTLNAYPSNDSSSFTIDIPLQWFSVGILALEWVQSLDFEENVDFGFVEFRTSDTAQWQNVFQNNYVYNVFGFDSSNVKMHNGIWGFTGQSDRNNMWVCLDLSFLWATSTNDTLSFRFSMLSDSVQSNQEGWMMDNFAAHLTAFHTINENKSDKFLNLSPNPSRGIIDISAQKTGTVQYIESIELVDLNGKIVKRWGLSPTKFTIDVSDQTAGVYMLRINSNIMKEEFKIVINP